MTENPGIAKAWHFVGATLRNGEPIPPDGEWLTWDGPLEMCHFGLHASIHPFDALTYAPGDTLCQVECQGYILGDDKLVARKRRILKRKDIKGLLRRFAKDQALSVCHLWDPPQIVLDYLQSDSVAARVAARVATGNAACDAALAAADNVTLYAAWAAARNAAWAVAVAAPGNAARAASWSGPGAAAWAEFLERVEKEFRS